MSAKRTPVAFYKQRYDQDLGISPVDLCSGTRHQNLFTQLYQSLGTSVSECINVK